ncbi:MAG: DUF4136 domain-containing protein [Vicinamibacterales bacterium]
MLRARALYVAVTLVLGAGVVSAQSVHTDHDPSVNFSSYRTYYWAKTDPVPGNEILNERIMWDVDAGMARRGWTKAPADQADLAVVANMTTQAQQKLETFYTGWGGWGWAGWGAVGTAAHTYLKGTMIVDLFDAKTKRLVWRGVATETVSYSPVKNAERIDQSIETMFGDQFLEND